MKMWFIGDSIVVAHRNGKLQVIQEIVLVWNKVITELSVCLCLPPPPALWTSQIIILMPIPVQLVMYLDCPESLQGDMTMNVLIPFCLWWSRVLDMDKGRPIPRLGIPDSHSEKVMRKTTTAIAQICPRFSALSAFLGFSHTYFISKLYWIFSSSLFFVVCSYRHSGCAEHDVYMRF